MVADIQTSMKELQASNLDFVSLLSQLKQFLSDTGTVTITAGGISKTLPTLPEAIRLFRGGDFDKVTLQSGNKTIILENYQGTLRITDNNGALVPLIVSKLKYSHIEDCSFDEATISQCTAEGLDARGTILASSAEVSRITVTGAFNGNSGSFSSLQVGDLSAGRAMLRDISVGRMAVVPEGVQQVFAAGGVPYGYASSRVLYYPVPGTHPTWHLWRCNDITQAEKAAGWMSPSTMGFVELPAPGSRLLQSPGMMTYCGDNEYEDYDKGDMLRVANSYIVGTGMQGYTATVNPNGSGFIRQGDDTSKPVSYGALLGWPIRSYVKDPSLDSTLPQTIYPDSWNPEVAGIDCGSHGLLLLHEIPAADYGRIVYLRTQALPWTIHRLLTVTYSGNQPLVASLSLPYEIPPYTCLRVRLCRERHVEGSVTYYTNTLELT